MKNQITKRQNQLLEVIYEYIRTTGYSPTFEEMREKLSVSSNQSIVDLLNKLKRGGYIKRDEGARSLVILPLGYETLEKPPLTAFLGASSAGAPIEAIEISGEWQTVSKEVSKLSHEVFLIKITGDSMINAGIENDDVVLVKGEKEFYSGDVVLVQVGDESMIKRFISEDKPPYVYLKPENPKYPIIPFDEQMRMTGKVISVLKNGYWKQTK